MPELMDIQCSSGSDICRYLLRPDIPACNLHPKAPVPVHPPTDHCRLLCPLPLHGRTLRLHSRLRSLLHICERLVRSRCISLVEHLQRRNVPFINPRTVLPSLLGGLLWSTGMLGCFVANDNLSQAVSFPIIGSMPGVCAALWSVFYFKDIRGRRDLILLSIAVGLTCLGALLVGLSKVVGANGRAFRQ